MRDGYDLILEGAPNAPLIDLLEWRPPKDPAAPYPNLYHSGIPRICFVSRDNGWKDSAMALGRLRLLSSPTLSPPLRRGAYQMASSITNYGSL